MAHHKVHCLECRELLGRYGKEGLVKRRGHYYEEIGLPTHYQKMRPLSNRFGMPRRKLFNF